MWIIHSVDKNKSASRFVISTYEPILDKIHDLRSNAITGMLIVLINP